MDLRDVVAFGVACGGFALFQAACGIVVVDAPKAGATTSSSSSASSTGGIGGASTTSSSSSTGAGGAPVMGCEPLVDCGGVCVDTTIDPDHCGGCGNACAIGQVCLSSACVSPTCSGIIEAEDTNQIAMSPGWSISSGNVLHAGAGLESKSDSSSATLSFSFTGTDLVFYYARGPNRGSMTVSVDSGPEVPVPGYAPDFVYQVPVLIVAGVPAGLHEVAVACVPGTGYCSPDYFGIQCNYP